MTGLPCVGVAEGGRLFVLDGPFCKPGQYEAAGRESRHQPTGAIPCICRQANTERDLSDAGVRGYAPYLMGGAKIGFSANLSEK
jgi:hypothetical protein